MRAWRTKRGLESQQAWDWRRLTRGVDSVKRCTGKAVRRTGVVLAAVSALKEVAECSGLGTAARSTSDEAVRFE